MRGSWLLKLITLQKNSPFCFQIFQDGDNELSVAPDQGGDRDGGVIVRVDLL